MRIAQLLLLLLLALVALGCQDGGPAAAAPLDDPEPAAAPALPEDVRQLAADVRAAAAPRPAETAVEATGGLEAVVESRLVARQAGRVGRLHADEGDRVEVGQPLLELEADYLELGVRAAAAEEAQAEAAWNEAKRELERKEELHAKESISRAVYDRAVAAFEKARAAHQLARTRHELAQKQLDDAVLRSPIRGVVAERLVDVGEHLGVSTVAFVVVQVDPLKLVFRLPERTLPELHRGHRVRAYVDPYPGEAFTGEIRRVGTTIDAASRSVEVEALLENADGRLRPGLFARVEVEVTGGDDAQDR